jgi:transposase
MRVTSHHINDHIGHHVRDDGNASADGFGCVEVITGVRHRRDWSDEEKLAIIAESFSTTTSISAVARRYGINKNQLFQWRRQFREGAFDQSERIDFVPVVHDHTDDAVAVMMADPVGATAGGSAGSTVIEVVIGIMTVRVPASADEVALRRVLGVVKALA